MVHFDLSPVQTTTDALSFTWMGPVFLTQQGCRRLQGVPKIIKKNKSVKLGSTLTILQCRVIWQSTVMAGQNKSKLTVLAYFSITYQDYFYCPCQRKEAKILPCCISGFGVWWVAVLSLSRGFLTNRELVWILFACQFCSVVHNSHLNRVLPRLLRTNKFCTHFAYLSRADTVI